MTERRVVYGPEWPDPANVIEFLEQALQFARAAIADGRPFQPQRAWLILVDDRGGEYQLADIGHAMNCTDAIGAMQVSGRRCIDALDPDGCFDPDA